MKLFYLLLLGLSFYNLVESQFTFIYTSSWYGSPSDVSLAKSTTIDVTECVKNRGLTPYYVTSGLSFLSPINSLITENSTLMTKNVQYAIGESNAFLEFIYPLNQTLLTKIMPMYPDDEELMKVVLDIFNKVSNTTIRKQRIAVIINRTQDFNNMLINNYENIIRILNGQGWTDVQFLEYISIDNIIINLRQLNYFTIISLLYDPNVNSQLIKQAFLSHLMTWKYQWIFVDLLGGDNSLNSTDYGQGVLTNNVTIITFAQNGLTGRSVLLQAAFNLTIDLICNSKQAKTSTLTGDFDSGNRLNFRFIIYQNPGNQSKNMGFATYNKQNKAVELPTTLQYINFVPSNDSSVKNLLVTGFKIGFVEFPPYSTKVNGNYSGFTIEILTGILKEFNITPTYIQLPVNDIGSFNPSNYTFSGILGLIQNGTIDTVSIPIILTVDRLTYFDFATNLLSGYIAGAYKNPKLMGINALSYYTIPFEWTAWITFLCGSVAIAIGLTITDFLYPDKYSRYKILMSVFFSFSSLTHGAYFDPPRRSGGRILMCFWWLYCLFVVVIWVSNYAALLAQQITQTQLTTFKSILSQNKFQPTTVNDNVVFSYLMNNYYPTPQTIFRITNEETVNGSVRSITDAINLAINGSYVFLYDDKTLYYYANKNCLSMFGKFSSFDYGIVLPKYSDKTLAISFKIKEWTTKGNTSVLINKYWPSEFRGCNSTNVIDIVSEWLRTLIPYPLASSFNIGNMIGVFVLVLIGGICAMILAVIEKIIRHLVLKNQTRRDKYKYENTVEQLASF